MNTLEVDSRKKYSDGSIYAPDKISASLLDAGDNFSALLLAEKLKLLLPHIGGKRILDLLVAGMVGIWPSLPTRSHSAWASISVCHSSAMQPRSSIRKSNLGLRARGCASFAIRRQFVRFGVDPFAALYYLDDIEPVYAELRRISDARRYCPDRKSVMPCSLAKRCACPSTIRLSSQHSCRTIQGSTCAPCVARALR